MALASKCVLAICALYYFPFSQAEAQDSAPIVPPPCRGQLFCSMDISLDQARKLSKSSEIEKNECVSDRKKERSAAPTGTNPNINPSTSISDMCELEALLFSDGCNDDSISYSWSTVENTSNGNNDLDKLQKYVKSYHLFHGYQIGKMNFASVIAKVKSTEIDIDRYALCRIRKIGNISGPPTNCHTVAIVAKDEAFIRVRKKGRASWACPASASIRIGGTIDISFYVKGKSDLSIISTSIASLLSDSIKMSFERDESRSDNGALSSVRFYATSGLRESFILGGGWREAFDFDLFLDRSEAQTALRGAVRPMVSRQASGSYADYEAPSDAQRDTYAKAIDEMVRSAIKETCEKPVVVDSKIIQCE